MGKSTVAGAMRRKAVAVIDTDELARQLTQPGAPALAEISKAFGPSVFRADGLLDRAALARMVFNDASARAQLEGILHPAIRAAWLAQADQWRRDNVKLGAVIIPLLFETGAESNFDATVCVACSAATQHVRLMERGWKPGEIAARIAAQWPVEKKIAHSDFVVWTDTPFDAAEAQLGRIIDSAGTLRKTPACA